MRVPSGARFAVALLVASCRNESEPGFYGTVSRHGHDPRTLYVNNGDEPEYLDPGLVSEQAGGCLVSDLFEGLVEQHPRSLQPIQGVAERYEQSDDNRFYRFHLRETARWSDGRDVVAEDFVYAWQRVMRPETGSRSVSMLEPLKNAHLFRQGRVLVATEPLLLRPMPDAQTGIAYPSGAPFRVHVLLPASTTAVPFVTVPSGELGTTPCKVDGTAELTVAGRPTPALQARATVTVLGVVGKTRCNEEDDVMLEVLVGGQRGHLPTCALVSEPNAHTAYVSTFDGMPTFRPKIASEVPAVRSGFLERGSLRRDGSILGVRAVSPRVLEVQLERATPYFLELLSNHAFFPVRRDVIERAAAAGDVDRWTRPENIVSNGPFVLEKHAFRYEIVFAKNPHYWAADKLKLDRVVWLEVGSHEAALALYKGGELDYLGSVSAVPETYVPLLRTQRDFSETPWQSSYWYELNVEKPPLDDVRVRRALNMAIDKRRLIDSVTHGKQTPATHFVPDYTGSGYDEAAKAAKKASDPFDAGRWQFDPQAARGLLREAGYDVQLRGERWVTAGFPALEILYNGAAGATSGHPAIAVAIQSLWREHLGISATLRNEEWKVMLKNMRDGHFQIARLGWSADYNHPHTYLETFAQTSPNNWTRWKSPEFDALLARATATSDSAESIDLYRQAESVALEAMPRLPLYFYSKATLAKPYLRGFHPNPMNRHPVRWMWIDSEWRSRSTAELAYEPLMLAKPGRLE